MHTAFNDPTLNCVPLPCQCVKSFFLHHVPSLPPHSPPFTAMAFPPPLFFFEQLGLDIFFSKPLPNYPLVSGSLLDLFLHLFFFTTRIQGNDTPNPTKPLPSGLRSPTLPPDAFWNSYDNPPSLDFHFHSTAQTACPGPFPPPTLTPNLPLFFSPPNPSPFCNMIGKNTPRVSPSQV